MSREMALIRFKDGTIMHGCYDGTCDVLSPYLITEEELNEKYGGSVFQWDNEQNKFADILYEELDGEEVEIYMDYGSGASWKGKANRDKMIITEGLVLDNVDWFPPVIPRWVVQYFEDKGFDTEHFKGMIGD